jgi:hypothetical protein
MTKRSKIYFTSLGAYNGPFNRGVYYGFSNGFKQMSIVFKMSSNTFT